MKNIKASVIQRLTSGPWLDQYARRQARQMVVERGSPLQILHASKNNTVTTSQDTHLSISEEVDRSVHEEVDTSIHEEAGNLTLEETAGSTTNIQNKQPAHTFNFMGLPAELRDEICDYYVCSIMRRGPVIACFSVPKDISRTLIDLPIYRVSKEIRKQALGSLCRSKTFQFWSALAMVTFIQTVGTLGRSGLRSVELVNTTTYDHSQRGKDELLQALQEMPKLESLTMSIIPKDPDYADRYYDLLFDIRRTVTARNAKFRWFFSVDSLAVSDALKDKVVGYLGPPTSMLPRYGAIIPVGL